MALTGGNVLPETPLCRVFSNLAITDRVSTSWSTYAQRESPQNPVSVSLFLGDPVQSQSAVFNNTFDIPYLSQLKDNTGDPLQSHTVLPSDEVISLQTLTDEHVKQLLSLFPAPKSLLVSLAPDGVTESLLSLLRAWRGSLTSFKLYTPLKPASISEGGDTVLDRASNCTRNQGKLLLAAINSLSSLRHLTVQWCHCFLPKRVKFFARLDLPILKHLEELYFYSEDRAEVLADSLQTYGEANENLRVVALAGYCDSKNRLALGLSTKFITNRFKQLHFDLRHADRAWMGKSPRPWAYFDSLTSLELKLALNRDWNFTQNTEPFSLVDFLRYLVPLKQLLHLKVTLTASDVTIWRNELEEIKEALDYGILADEHGFWLMVPSLKVLSLHLVPDPISCQFGDGDGAIDSHSDLGALQLHRFFPDLQVLRLSVSQEEASAPGFACADCLNKKDGFEDWQGVCLPRMINWCGRAFEKLLFVETTAVQCGFSKVWKAAELMDDEWMWSDSDDDDLLDDTEESDEC